MKRIEPLSDDELALLDDLDVNLRAGHLGRCDGWYTTDVSSDAWDPIDFV